MVEYQIWAPWPVYYIKEGEKVFYASCTFRQKTKIQHCTTRSLEHAFVFKSDLTPWSRQHEHIWRSPTAENSRSIFSFRHVPSERISNPSFRQIQTRLNAFAFNPVLHLVVRQRHELYLASSSGKKKKRQFRQFQQNLREGQQIFKCVQRKA
jgi:hypothetical protein